MRSRLSIASIFSASLRILLWTGKAAGFCASVFENQQGKYRFFSLLSFKRKQINITEWYFKEWTLTHHLHQISVEFLELPQPFFKGKRERGWMKLEVYCLNKWDEIANIMKKKTGIESLKKLLLNYICRWENTHVRGQVMASFWR